MATAEVQIGPFDESMQTGQTVEGRGVGDDYEILLKLAHNGSRRSASVYGPATGKVATLSTPCLQFPCAWTEMLLRSCYAKVAQLPLQAVQ